jgi:hypothetical protein
MTDKATPQEIAQQVIADWHDVEKWRDPSMMPIPAFSGAQEAELTRLIAERLNNFDEAVSALKQIAAFNDEGASKHLEQTGSYSSFDEPGSVEIARKALASVKGKG